MITHLAHYGLLCFIWLLFTVVWLIVYRKFGAPVPSAAGAGEGRSSSINDGSSSHDQTLSEGPMSDYSSSALIAYREKLKTNVAMKPHLFDRLEEQAGGFMTRAEAQSVRKAEDPMGWLIEILLGKGDREFHTFCDMLDKSNHCAWANSLRLAAKMNRQKEDRKAVVSFVRPEYDVEEADRYYLEKAIKKFLKDKKLDTLKLKKDLYRHTYYSVERILEVNAQHFRHMVRAAELATEDEEVARALATTRTVAELLDKLCIKTKWEDTELLAEIVLCLPKEARRLAMKLLNRYDGYLEVYDTFVPAQDSLQKQLAVPELTKSQIPVEVTVTKCLTEFMNKDCKDIVNLLLHNSYKIPRIKIMATAIQPGSTTVVFLIDKAFTENIIHSSRKVSSLWAFQELRVTRLRFSDFELNVVQLLTQHFKEALCNGLTGSMDFVGATKALPYQVYALVDPDISEKLVIRTVYGKIAHPCPEQEEVVSGTADNEEVETTPEMHEENFPPKVEEAEELDNEGKIKEATDRGELLSRVQELQDALKDSEVKNMNLTHKNMALENNLKVCQEQKDHTEQEIASLKERLVSMLSSQGGADKDSAMIAPSGVCSKRIPCRWWLKVSAGSYDTSLLPSSPMEQAKGGREMEAEVVFRRDTKSNLLKAVSGTEWMYRRGALERGRQANLRRHQFTRYHRRWLADNVQKDEEDSCKLWLLQLTPDVGTVREREEHQADEGKMSEEVTGSGELLSRVQKLEDELKDSEQKRMDLIQSNTALQKILKACREQEVRAQQEIASFWERLGGADQDSAPTAPSEGPLKRIPRRWWLKVSAGSYDTSLLPSSPMEQTEGSREMEGEVVFRRDTTSTLLKAVSGTEWMYRRGALERGRRSATANLHQHQFTRYHRSWLADNVLKEKEESCKLWLLRSSPDVGSVREEEEQGLMSKVYEQALRDYQEKIGGVLIVENIISDLEPYLTKVEYLQVESKLGNMAQVDELFRILLTKGNRHFKGFCHVLEDNGYQHWAQQLRSSTDGTETKAGQSDTPKVSFAILTANEREELAVNGFLRLDPKCVDQVKYPHASTLLYSSDAVLRDAKAKVKPLPDARYTHRLFSLEVNGSKQVGVHVYCDKMGPWGALHKTVELLKTARDENWELRYIFIVGHCGASVTEAKKNDFPRGTILLAEQVKDYLNTGKVEEDCEEDIAEEMVSGRAPTFKVKGSPTTYQMNAEVLTQMIGVQEMDTRGAFNRIEVKKVDYLSGPLVIKSSLFGDTFRDPSVDACGVEIEAVGVLKAVETFHALSGGPKVEVVLAKGISDYTGHKGESGSCKFFDKTIEDANDDQLQMNAAMQAIALVIRLVAKKMTWLFGSS